ncbi:(4Fe-4S)-binding protein [Candidatus Roizmanbacteria bacterium]|nr:(4Fe-4S)-binding protein [Candidatus Roizmanbacteria bacterium]
MAVHNKPTAFAAHHINNDIRMQSSSGGIFTAIAEYVIGNNGVVFGACFDNWFNVVHDYAETSEDLQKMRGSKYVQSRIGSAFEQVGRFLDQKRLVLFTGTPCQIAGLKSYLRSDNEYLVTQDIICHGVPSPKAWNKYLELFSKKGPIQTISFRNKDTGWSEFSMKVTFATEQYRRDLSKDYFLKAFLRNLCLRPSCYQCHFKTLHRESDITLADFWGIEVVLPAMNDDKGISLVLINSEKGKQVFQAISKDLICKPVDYLQATKYNKAATQSISLPEKRQDFLAHLNELPFDSLVEKHTKEKIRTIFRRFVLKIGSKTKKKLLHNTTKG